MSEYRPSDGSSVADYFSRFKWALELSQIPQIQYANYARVHMGVELNNALKFLVSPQDPATIDFEVLQTTLVNHFDRKKNKYVESIKFWQIVQQTGESVAQFVLRLRQGAADCEYEDFLDRMLIEQLLHGLEAREMCDEIIAKKPATFKEAYEIAYTLEATRNTAREVNTGVTSSAPEETNRLGYESLRTRRKSTFNHPKNVHGEQRTNIQPDNEKIFDFVLCIRTYNQTCHQRFQFPILDQREISHSPSAWKLYRNVLVFCLDAPRAAAE
ncbi:AAEL013485-PA [Aedes aegypti]|uniref:AAEL013485-PA n=1 Tax=Aedes aegypti TaxID=7159 RepID=Q16J06_AEDAE|nr:AAEL013485-PA [Aedes aegypti]